MKILRLIAAVIRKDIRIEIQNKEILIGTLIYALTVLLILHFAVESFTARAEAFSGGILWIAFTFSATIGLVRLFSHEEENGLFLALRLMPLDKGYFFIGKWLVMLIGMTVTQWIITPLFSVLFDVAVLPSVPLLFGIYLLGSAGYAAMGVFTATAAMHTRMRSHFVPLILFPLTIPAIIASVEATQMAINQPDTAFLNSWTQLLLAYDLIAVTAGFFLYEPILED